MKNSKYGPLSNTIRLLLLATLVMGLTLGTGQKARAFASPAPVDLGAAAPFVILSKTGVTNVPVSNITGNIGTSPIDSTAITGFSLVTHSTNTYSTSAQVTGKIYAANNASPTPANLTTAVSNMETAFANAAGRSLPDATELYSGNLSGQTIAPGLYKWSTDVLITTNVTLAGPADAVWIFQIAGDLIMGSGAQVLLSGGAQAGTIFWQVGGGTGVEIGTTAHVEGTILAAKAIHLRTGASLNGRALSQTAVTLDKNVLVIPSANGGDTVGVFRPGSGLIYLKNTNTAGFADIAINYGNPGDYPLAGDWDGNGTDTIGVVRNGVFYLRNSNTAGFADIMFTFGLPGDQPIAGDWNGDGIVTVGVYRNGVFLLRNSNSAGAPDVTFSMGNPGDVGISGDWNGDGLDTTGVFRPSNGALYLKNSNTSGFADIAVNYGLAGDKPVTGDWDNDGIDTIGVYRNAQFLLRNSNTVGFADIVFAFGNPGDMPIAGNWDGLP
ncbi:ice-binding family protein [Candidatus Villigracilis saccharophilus]|uniref:ice-binding family protein n=1 Tax=Candidatus Villigracilis saccharophilus TaxID=3140684 RepID=UPI0031360C92|nr:DUF3494 domain-containing protein [Anaerolineales bacterium]